MKKGHNRHHFFAILILVVSVILITYSVFNYAYLEEEVKQGVQAYGLIGTFIFSAFLEFVPQYISPHIFLVSGAFLNIDWLTILLVVLMGSSLGAIFGFEVGHRFRRKASLLEKWIGKKKTEKFEKGINKGGVWFIVLAAISPIPYIPLILGMMHLSRKNFFIYGLIPRIISFAMFYPIYQIILNH